MIGLNDPFELRSEFAELRFNPIIELNNGITMSVQAHRYAYCTPRDDAGPYTHVEVAFVQPSFPVGDQVVEMPIEWAKYADDGTRRSHVYGYVPIELVKQFISDQGGIKFGCLP